MSNTTNGETICKAAATVGVGVTENLNSNNDSKFMDEQFKCKPFDPLKILNLVEHISSTTNSLEMQIIINKYVSFYIKIIQLLYIYNKNYFYLYTIIKILTTINIILAKR